MEDEQTPADATAGAADDGHETIPTGDLSESASSSLPQFAETISDAGSNYLTPEEEARRRLLHEAAVNYWSWGFRVVRLNWVTDAGHCSCERGADCASKGKHPIEDKWQKPSDNADSDAGWWRMLAASGEDHPADWQPRANVGILTGAASGIFVVDIDPDHGGDVRFEELAAEHEDEPIPPTLVTRTGSGGRHYYFRHPGWNVGNVKPWGKDAGIDIRGDGGQVVAPPSISDRGPYSYVETIENAGQIAMAPRWILESLRQEKARQYGERIDNVQVLPDPLISAYVRAALDREAAVMRKAPKGDRNNRLNSCALSLGTLGAHGLLSEEEAWAALHDAAVVAGLNQSEIRPTFSSGWRAGLQRPRDLSAVGEIANHAWPLLPRDEFGLGDRLVVYRGTEMRWVEEWSSWMICSNGRWIRRSDAEAERLAQDVIRMLPLTEGPQLSSECDEGEEQSPRQMFDEWLRKQANHGKVVAMTKIARDRPPIRAAAGDFDGRPTLLNVANGIVDLATGELSPHDPEMMLTLQSPVTYDPSLLADPFAGAPLWKAFLERVQPDPEMRHYLQRVMGYSATGSTSEQVMWLHDGVGANGKSVFHEVLSFVLGPYAQATPVETLTAKRNDGGVPNDVARMVGKRYLVASEAKEGKKLDWQLIKQLVGGDMVPARFMRAEFFEFRPTGKIHLTANHLPPIPTDDPAIWRRLLRITWPVFIPPEDRDGELGEKLCKEARGILAWVVQGAMAWNTSRLGVPQAAEVMKDEYREEEDIVAPLIGECLEVTAETPPSQRVVGHDIREIYTAALFFWKTNGFEPLSQRALTTALKKKGFHYVKSNSKAYFTDLMVRAIPAS
jgi:putative DNA primase/helicase